MRRRQLYEWLLLAYPASFRDRFGPQMLETFQELTADNAHRAPRVKRRVLLREFTGVLRTAPCERITALRDTLQDVTSQPVRETIFFAIAIFSVILAVYTATLAPSVTFWDAGEFLAAAKTLGLPHPPGTPLFVLLMNSWATIFPVGDFAFRINLLTAVCGAAATTTLATTLYVVLRHSGTARVASTIAAASAAFGAAFSLTVWQNSNETEVYMVSALMVAISIALAVMWSHRREVSGPDKTLLVMIYLCALSVGNHLLGLLIGPAVITYLAFEMRAGARTEARTAAFAKLMAFTATWCCLVAVGLGSPTLLMVFAAVTSVVGLWCWQQRVGRFAIHAIAAAFFGVSTYAFLYIRANLDPGLNQADPSTWDSLVAVIQRAQYPVRLPTDDPTSLSGPLNPGRPWTIIQLQILNYLQYFWWQWTGGSGPTGTPVRFTMLPVFATALAAGLLGAKRLYHVHRAFFWLLAAAFLTFGPVLMGYMNFKPGFSIGYDIFPNLMDHEVRERDYFFVISFQLWGLVAGLGVFVMWDRLRVWLASRNRGSVAGSAVLTSPVLLIVAMPLLFNLGGADRARAPGAHLARDFGYNLLQSVEPNGILFTNGDNDSYPALYQQFVEGTRPDVTVVIMPMIGSEWYARQTRERPSLPFDPQQAPWFDTPRTPQHLLGPITTLSDHDIRQITQAGQQYTTDDLNIRVGDLRVTYPGGTAFTPGDLIALRIIQENAGRRPMYFSLGARGQVFERLGDSLVQEGMVFRLYTSSPQNPDALGPGVLGSPIDMPRSETLVNEVYRYGGLFDTTILHLDSAQQTSVVNLAYSFISMGWAHASKGDTDVAATYFARAQHLAPSPWLEALTNQASAPWQPNTTGSAPDGRGEP